MWRWSFVSRVLLLLIATAFSVACGGSRSGLPTMAQSVVHGRLTAAAVSPSATATPRPIKYEVALNVTASIGGTLSLADGTSVAFDPGALSASGLVTLIEYAGSADAAPTGCSSVGNSLLVTEAPLNPSIAYALAPTHPMAASVPAIHVAVSVGSAGTSSGFLFLSGSSALPNGSATSFAVIADVIRSSVVASLNPAVFGSATAKAIQLTVIEWTGAAGHSAASPGLRFGVPGLNPATGQLGYTWAAAAPMTPASCTHPVLFLHGILADLESTYASSTITAYAENGHYDCVLGYEYNWLLTPDVLGPQIAAAVNAYFGRTLPNLDIVAHSYGGINAIAAIPLLHVNEIQNFSAFKSPLNGAYLTDVTFAATLFAEAIALGLTPASGSVISIRVSTRACLSSDSCLHRQRFE